MIDDKTMRLLLLSLRDGKKAVHMRSSPIAIEAAWQAENKKLVRNLGSLGHGSQTWWIELTDNGRKFIEESESLNKDTST